MKEEEKIRQLYIDLCNACISKDIMFLNEILSDDYVLIHMTGMHQIKTNFINSVMNGELKYYDVEHESIKVKIDGDTAYVTGKTKTLASPFGMIKSWWNLKQDITLKKINGKWIITEAIASAY